MILGFRELGNNPLLCLASYKLLLNCFVDFEFPHFKKNCENWKRSVEEQRKCLMGCKIGLWGKMKGVSLLSQENGKLR